MPPPFGRASALRILPSLLLIFAVISFWHIWSDRGGSSRGWFRGGGAKWLLGEKGGKAASSTSGSLTKSIVMGALARENVSWVADELPDWEHAIYIVDADEAGVETAFKVPQNKGNEGNAYLWHIIQHYDDLTDIILFLHAHRDGVFRAWHVDNKEHSNPANVHELRLDAVQRHGYVSLRCTPVPGCPQGMDLLWNTTVNDLPAEPQTGDYLPFALQSMFPMGVDTPDSQTPVNVNGATVKYPDRIAAPCCAQFAVTREQVRQRPKSDYERYHRWLMSSDLPNAASGRVMEFLWHIIFGRPSYFCPVMEQCFCEVLGRCQ